MSFVMGASGSGRDSLIPRVVSTTSCTGLVPGAPPPPIGAAPRPGKGIVSLPGETPGPLPPPPGAGTSASEPSTGDAPAGGVTPPLPPSAWRSSG
jgi:hypothetical protein